MSTSNGSALSEVEQSEAANDAIMSAAAASALVGVTLQHGGPFGASIVRNGIFVSLAHNTVLSDNDPTCHAEMNAIRYACAALGSHDLSDCELFTTCEPCPMCWGAIQWSRLRKVYTGVDRFTAARFGFDDKVFYDELAAQNGHYAVGLGKNMPQCEPCMLEVFPEVEADRIKGFIGDVHVNKTFRRRVGEQSIGFHSEEANKRFSSLGTTPPAPPSSKPGELPEGDHVRYMTALEDAVHKAVRHGKNKEREIFAACVVGPDGAIVSIAVNEVLARRDATATSEVIAIREASRELGTYNLEGCSLYTTVEPDVMSLGAILWSRIGRLFFGLSQKTAAKYGFEEGLLQYRELFAKPEIVQKVFAVETGVGAEACEDVFKRWQRINAVVY